MYEWVNDRYDGSYYGTLSDGAVNPQGPANSEGAVVLKGGSWLSSMNELRAAYRNWNEPTSTYSNDGFRCALSYSP